MSFLLCVIFALFITISIIHPSATSLVQTKDNQYEQYKRLLFHSKRASDENDIFDKVIHPSSFSNQQNLDSLINSCIINPCENGGICIPNEQMSYSCQCSYRHHGQHCEKNTFILGSKRQSLRQLLKQVKRNMNKQRDSDEDDGERAYYDFRNGIYF
ncbi:hypothetical protein I4U23_000710 [Adineta vaga]|nr:hypothetical protein I4U23_000710 [Adineta vaga]